MLNILKTYRFDDWFCFIGFILIGFSLKSSLNLELLKYVLLSSFLLAYAFSLNNFYDRHETKRYFLWPLFFIFPMLFLFNIYQILLSFLFLIIVTLYSAYPFRLKNIPIISSLLNGFGLIILFFIGYFHLQSISAGLLVAPFLFSLQMVSQFIHEIVDLKEDKKNKIVTTAGFLGKEKIKKLCCGFLWFALLVSACLFYLNFVNILFIFITFLFVTFFTYRMFTTKIDKNLRKEYKKLGIIVGLIYFILLFKP